eukprot:638554-Rhodomonas_salina.1
MAAYHPTSLPAASLPAAPPAIFRLLDAGILSEFVPAERAGMCSAVSRRFSESIGSNKTQPVTLFVHGDGDEDADDVKRARRFQDVTRRYRDHHRLSVDAFRSPKGVMALMHKTAWTHAAAGVQSVQLVDVRFTNREGAELSRAMRLLTNVEFI